MLFKVKKKKKQRKKKRFHALCHQMSAYWSMLQCLQLDLPCCRMRESTVGNYCNRVIGSGSGCCQMGPAGAAQCSHVGRQLLSSPLAFFGSINHCPALHPWRSPGQPCSFWEYGPLWPIHEMKDLGIPLKPAHLLKVKCFIQFDSAVYSFHSPWGCFSCRMQTGVERYMGTPAILWAEMPLHLIQVGGNRASKSFVWLRTQNKVGFRPENEKRSSKVRKRYFSFSYLQKEMENSASLWMIYFVRSKVYRFTNSI